MKKQFLKVFMFGLVLTGCETTKPTIGFWEHYNNCSMAKNTIKDISNCGKESRLNYIKEVDPDGKKGMRGQRGDAYMLWVDLLAKQVDDKEITDTAAKMKLLEMNNALASRQAQIEMQALQNDIAILNSIQNSMPKTYNCTTSSFGTTTCTGN
jgi:hypothetical protein